MKIVSNSIIPFKGFLVINLFGIFFVRHCNAEKVTEKVITHERIHTAQMRELGFVPFYILYLLEWLFWLLADTKNAYKRISFEQEALYGQSDPNYLTQRKHFAQWR